MLRNHALFIGFSILALTSWAARAQPALTTLQIEAMTYEGSYLKVGYELPCGAESFGVLVVNAPAAEGLKLAMLTKMGKIACTGMPRRVVEILDFVSTRGYKKVSPLDVSAVSRVSPQEVTAIQVVPSRRDARQNVLKATYDSACGQPLGSILRRADDKVIEVSIAEVSTAPNAVPDQSCTSKPVSAQVSGVAVHPETRFRPLTGDETIGVERVMYLRLAEISPGGIQTKADGLEVRYQRTCNEAPVGIVTTGRLVERVIAHSGMTTPKLAVGVLVAHYYNLICPKGQQAKSWETISSQDVVISAGTSIQPLPATQRTTHLQVRQPTEYAVMNKAKGAGLVLDIASACDKQVGAVYSHDRGGNLAIGILELPGSPYACKTKSKEVSLIQPFTRKPTGGLSIYPMRVAGLEAR